MKNFLKGAKNKWTEMMDGIERATLPENAVGSAKTLENAFDDFALDKKTDGKDKAQDGDNRTTPDKDMEGKKIASKAAEERVQAYFSEYAIEKIEYAGETISKGLEAYNFCLKDKDGVKIFAQISQTDGKLIRFDYYKECKDRNFSSDGAKMIAEAFLEKLGYKDMTATRLSEFGTDADFLFVKNVDGFLAYPQAVKVKVCEERGVVTGFDASEYLKNGHTVYEPNVKISLLEAQEKLHKGLSVVNSQACIIDVVGKPKAAYEFICNYEENTYLVYVDAATGNEISILNVRELA
jgi:germination protein YpeB